MNYNCLKPVAFAIAVAATLMTASSAGAQGFNNIPTMDPPPKIMLDDLYDYQVYFAGPQQTGYMLHNDRGLVQGPYSTREEAEEVGDRTPWVIYWVVEVEIPQTWYYWETFDGMMDASREASWLRSLGFDARIESVPQGTRHFR